MGRGYMKGAPTEADAQKSPAGRKAAGLRPFGKKLKCLLASLLAYAEVLRIVVECQDSLSQSALQTPDR